MDTKICTACLEEKPLTEFSKRKSRGNGKHPSRVTDGLNSKCKACIQDKKSSWRALQKENNGVTSEALYAREHRESQAKWKAARVAELKVWLNDLRETTPCAECDRYFPAVCMDFDHVRGEKKMDVMKMAGQGYARAMVEDEVSKCELVCANCHRLRTHASDRERPWYDERRKYDRSNWGL